MRNGKSVAPTLRGFKTLVGLIRVSGCEAVAKASEDLSCLPGGIFFIFNMGEV